MPLKLPGEFELIKKLTSELKVKNRDVIVGIGDDCAVLSFDKNYLELVTCDIQVAGRHFVLENLEPENIGHKAIAINISDIAAMGGLPTVCLISLILPKNISTDFVQRIYRGIDIACNKYNIQVAGGNISSGKDWAIDIFMLGKVKKRDLLLRSGANIGDNVLVTGTLGDAAAGLFIAKDRKFLLVKTKRLLQRQLAPNPRIGESKLIAASHMATAMIDVSDGLSGDIGHICERSRVGVEIYEDKLPVAKDMLEFAKSIKKNPYDLALNGGEDYELLFTVSKKNTELLISKIKKKTNTNVNIIGKILPEKEGSWLVNSDGKRIRLKLESWDHILSLPKLVSESS
ncbi:thiamine-phosphate kinase [Patescibacteria group bacterium]|nr:thiamine-phosphate kinase [Patescibacteria group bacterium]